VSNLLFQTTYDGTPKIELTEEFLHATCEHMRAYLSMMRDSMPDLADSFQWGLCRVGDLALQSGLMYEYGGFDDRPELMPITFNVGVVLPSGIFVWA